MADNELFGNSEQLNDTISRQAAIETVRKCAIKEVTPAYMLIDKAEAMTELMMLPSAQPELRWIPVSEKLPEIKEHHTSEPCIVYCDNGAYAFAELEENIFGQVGWDCERDDDYHEAVGTVIAWMPLPEPYKGEASC